MSRSSRRFAAAWLLAASSAFAQSPPATSDGEPSCPCIDVTDGSNSCFMGRKVPCYPPEYGSRTCRAHNVGVSRQCNATTPASFCTMSWCYVDREICRSSVYDVQASTQFPGSGLFFSYGTCGFEPPGEHRPHSVTDIMSGRTFRVGIPRMEYPQHFKRDASGRVVLGIGELYRNDMVPWEGSMIDYAASVFQFADFDVNYTWVSDGARAQRPDSEWTAAVKDVQQGMLDFAVSDFWLTLTRTEMSPFLAHVDADAFHLWVPRPSQDTSIEILVQKPFSPFHWSLWALIAGIMVCMSLIEVWLFRDEWRDDGFDEWAAAKKPWQKAKVVFMEWAHRGSMTTMHILSGFPELPRSKSQQIQRIGWAFFVFVFLASYTANLAAFLTKPQAGEQIRSMQDAISQNAVICVEIAIEDEMRFLFPSVAFSALPYNDNTLAEEYRAHRCDVLVYPLAGSLVNPELVASLCELNLVQGEEVLSTPISWPAQQDLVGALTFWVMHAHAQTGETYQGHYAPKYYSSRCAADGSDVTRLDFEEIDEFAQLYPAHFAAPMMLMAVTLCGAIFISFLERPFRERRASLEQAGAEREPTLAAVVAELDEIKQLLRGSMPTNTAQTRVSLEQQLGTADPGSCFMKELEETSA